MIEVMRAYQATANLDASPRKILMRQAIDKLGSTPELRRL